MTLHSTVARYTLRFADLLRHVETTDGFVPLVIGLSAGRSGSIDGAWGSSGALSAASLGLRASQGMLSVIAFPRHLDGWADDIATFAGQRPVIFPAWDNAASESDPLDEIAGQM